MVDGLTLAARVRWRLTPWWGRVLVVYLASRVVTTVIMLAMAVVEGRANGTATPDYFRLAANWDGEWYWVIALQGYPSVLPTDEAGHVLGSVWAFLPVYPLVLGAPMRIGFPFPIIAVVVTVLCGAAAALLFERMLRAAGLGASSALFGVVLLCTVPLSPMFQVSYADVPGLALLFGAILLVQRRRFLLAIPVIVVMALTRPSGLAFAFFLLLYLVVRVVRWRRQPGAHPLPLGEFAGIVAAGLVSFAAGLAWPAIAWAVTGSPSAYLDTELAWRADYLGFGELVPFQAWFEGIAFWLRFMGAPADAALGLAVVLMVVLVGLFAVVLLSPAGRRLGVELRLWLVAYLVYLLAVFFPQSSTWRLLLPLVPAVAVFAVAVSGRPRGRTLWAVMRLGLVVLGVLGQIVWAYSCWIRVPGDWSPP